MAAIAANHVDVPERIRPDSMRSISGTAVGVGDGIHRRPRSAPVETAPHQPITLARDLAFGRGVNVAVARNEDSARPEDRTRRGRCRNSPY